MFKVCVPAVCNTLLAIRRRTTESQQPRSVRGRTSDGSPIVGEPEAAIGNRLIPLSSSRPYERDDSVSKATLGRAGKRRTFLCVANRYLRVADDHRQTALQRREYVVPFSHSRPRFIRTRFIKVPIRFSTGASSCHSIEQLLSRSLLRF